MNVHCRCRACGARQTKPRAPSEYVRGPVCRRCRRRDTLRVDKWANTRQWRKNVCRCDGYPYPHRVKFSLWCRHNPDHPHRPPNPELFEALPETEEAPF